MIPDHVGHSCATIRAIDVLPTPLRSAWLPGFPLWTGDEGMLALFHPEVQTLKQLFSTAFRPSPASGCDNRHTLDQDVVGTNGHFAIDMCEVVRLVWVLGVNVIVETMQRGEERIDTAGVAG